MADNLQFAGEFSLEKCDLISSSGVAADISKIVAEINIFEDIFSTALTGSIILADTNNLVDNMPIIGQEYISMKIITPGLDGDDGIDFTENVFCVYEMGGRTPSGSNSEIIELKICSPELLRNQRTRISKAYEESISVIVQSIMENEKYINTKKDLYIEPTLGIRKILSPNFHPFHLIRQLKRESMSAKNDSPHYLFFENKNGFHFRSLQSLYSDGVQGEYHFGDKGTDEQYSSGDSGKLVQSYKRIINLSVPNKNNSLLDIKGGMLGSTLIMHDIYNKRYKTSTFSYFEDHNKHERLEESSAPKYNNVLIDEENTVGSFTNSSIHLHPTSIIEDGIDSQYMSFPTPPPTTMDLVDQGVDFGLARAAVEEEKENPKENPNFSSNRADKWLLQRRQRIHELNTGMTINMTIHGNTSVTAGQVIKVSLPVFGQDHEDTINSKHQSGLYLISKLRHTFNPPTRTHTISLQATKDSYPINFEQKASGKEPKRGGLPTVFEL
jgi:hypothetical protein